MFCKDCGTQLAKDARFCPHCGSAQAVIPPAETQEPDQSFGGKVRATGKDLGFSTAFLIAAICLTFVQVAGFMSVSPAAALSDFLAEFGMVSINIPALLDNLSLPINIISMLPGLLICLGLWISFFSCASRKPKANTAGLSIIFAVNLVQMVLTCLTLLAAMIPLVFVCTGADTLADTLFYGDDDLVEAFVLTAGIILLVIFAFALLYYSKLCATISNIRSTLKTGVPNKKVSRFVAILCYISGGFMILSGIFSFLSSVIVPLNGYYDGITTYELHAENFLSAVTSLLTATAQIIFGALLFTYRRKMAALEEEDRLATFQTLSHAEPYTSPVYIPPEPVAEPEAANEELDETKRWDL